MIEFGKTLREAREQKGYTVSQLADMTHILPQIIENLEHEDFSKIVAPIYGRGFVKLYCEAVGLEAKPLIDEFMSIYNGDRPPVIRMREDGGEAATPVEPEPPRDEPAEPRPEVVDEPPPVMADPLAESERIAPKRDYRLPGYSMTEVPKRYWRFGVLLVAAVVIVTLLVLGTRALYRATMEPPASQEMADENDAPSGTPRKGVTIAPLYID